MGVKIKYHIICVFIFLIPFFSQSQEDIFVKGNEAYKNGEYELAIQSYMTLISQGIISSELYYNLGNAYFKQNEIGEAIWAYEKANKINPGDDNTIFNLNFVSDLTVDKILSKNYGIAAWLKKIFYFKNVNLWSYSAILSSFLAAIFIYVFLISKKKSNRYFNFLMGIVFLFVMVLSLCVGYFQKQYLISNHQGVIVNAVTKIYIEPKTNANVSFELHEGAKIEVKEEIENWYRINLNQNEGWVNKDEIWLY